MVDNLTSEVRRRVMSRVGNANTGPEMIVRRLAHSLGYRFRLHRRDLPGTPDLVFPRLNKVIFVHGCFWHGHSCRKGRRPSTNVEFWSTKLDANIRRDSLAVRQLNEIGWEVLVIWECETRSSTKVFGILQEYLGNVNL